MLRSCCDSETEQRCFVARCPDDQVRRVQAVAERVLRERRVDDRQRLFIEIAQRRVLGDANDLHPLLLIELQPARERIPAGEEPPGRGFVDDGDGGDAAVSAASNARPVISRVPIAWKYCAVTDVL